MKYEFIIIYFLLILIIYVIIMLVKRYQDSGEKIISLTDIKNFMWEKSLVINRTETGAIILKDFYVLEYVRQKNNNILEETVIFRTKDQAVTITFIFKKGELIDSHINGYPLNAPKDNPDDYIAAHKLLELGQQAWLGKFQVSQY